LAIGSRFTGDIYHERFATLESYAYTWYRSEALDFFYLFSQERIVFSVLSVHIQGVSHYQCGLKRRFHLLSHLFSFTADSNCSRVLNVNDIE
jgi:hypothetical protein